MGYMWHILSARFIILSGSLVTCWKENPKKLMLLKTTLSDIPCYILPNVRSWKPNKVAIKREDIPLSFSIFPESSTGDPKSISATYLKLNVELTRSLSWKRIAVTHKELSQPEKEVTTRFICSQISQEIACLSLFLFSAYKLRPISTHPLTLNEKR